MNWLKVLRHDIRCGLLRKRYFMVPILFILPCIACKLHLDDMGLRGTIGDYLIYIAEGKACNADVNNLDTSIPIFWLLIILGCLLLNLDYYLNDLTHYGQQVIVRSRSRIGWFVSKCIWNTASVLMCFIVGFGTIVTFASITGCEFSFKNTPVFLETIYTGVVHSSNSLTGLEVTMITIVGLYITVAAFSMMEMVLCTILPPVVSFVLCVCQLFVSFFVQSPYVLGNAAMAIRSNLISESGIPTLAAVLFSFTILILAAICGTLRMKQVDVLGSSD